MTGILPQSVFVVIPAGGSGQRFGGNVKKQFLTLGGETILMRTLRAFLAHPQVSQVLVALPQDELDAQKKSFMHEKLRYVLGGASRAESVKKGFAAIENAKPDDVVLVHDGVRPLLSQDLITAVIQSVVTHGTGLPVLPVSDTMKEIRDNQVKRTIDRTGLGSAQTPQGARYGVFAKCYEKIGNDLTQITDEAMLLEKCGEIVITVSGERENIKVTTPFDLIVAQAILKEKL
jgi:2-C-methyl-D-erythritol 4-phosphate cytidylyltransferase